MGEREERPSEREESGSGSGNILAKMSEPGSSSDEGSFSFSSKSESAMSESSGSLLESCTRETLDDLPNRQTLAIASSSSMALGEGVVFDAIPIVRSEFTADHLKNNLLNNEKQVEALRQSCNIPRSVGRRSDDRLAMQVMAEYHDRLQEVERYKAKLKENKQLVDEARRNKGLLTQALQLKDETMESLKRRNGENLRLKKLFEATKKQLEVATLEVSKVRGELDGALVEISELEKSIPTEREAAVQEYLSSSTFHLAIKPYCAQEARFEKRKWMAVLDRYDDGSILRKYHEDIDEHHRKGETFVLAVDPSSEDESDNEGSADAQTQHGEEDLGDAEDDGRTRSDTARGSASDENE
ncbi:hypothetical protein DVH24_026456 [Malus domestica]|uniref:Uncharacterized protein n=1 Tax=Malus domestica TaxID=3750 RepID=A0A498KG58_MALDO|nr:hypothetical protein DVH24_026456 [Malus domestica]